VSAMSVRAGGVVAYDCRDNGRMPGVSSKLCGRLVGINASDWSSLGVKDIAMRTHAGGVGFATAEEFNELSSHWQL
jgi:hypothetical protein